MSSPLKKLGGSPSSYNIWKKTFRKYGANSKQWSELVRQHKERSLLTLVVEQSHFDRTVKHVDSFKSEKMLLVAILAEACNDLAGLCYGAGKKELRWLGTETKNWFESNEVYCDSTKGVSFAFICRKLNV